MDNWNCLIDKGAMMAELHIRLPENVKKIIRKEAAKLGLSMSQYVGFVLTAYANSDKEAKVVMLNGEKP